MPLIPVPSFKTPRKAAAARVAQLYNVPAPVGGLNYRDPIAAMAPTDALVLTNFIPRQLGVELRKGWQYTTSAIGASVGSIFAYNAANSANNKIFAAASGNIYDCTTSTPSVSQSSTGSSDNLWWTCQFDTGADMFLLAVSPSAGYWTYSTSTGWVKRTPTNLPSNPRTVMVWKRRVWFTVDGSSKAYYLDAVNAITGTAVAFEMGAQLGHGGSLSVLMNWTIDAGLSVDDFMVAIGTQGDLMVWEGTDPTSTTTFGLKGTWYIGAVPKYGRYFAPHGGDMIILSEMGLVPMSRLLNGQFVQDQGPAAKVQDVLAPLILELRNNVSWDLITIASETLLMVKLPTSTGVYTQYCMNLITGAWCKMASLPIECITLLDGNAYVGTSDGRIARVFYGSVDGAAVDGTGGDVIEGDVQTSFQTFGQPAVNKKFDMARPIFIAPSAPSVLLQLNTQYTFEGVAGSPTYSSISDGAWDSAVWNVALWTGGSNTYQSWVGVAGLGYYGSIRMKVRGAAKTVFTSSHVMATTGGMM